MLQILHEQVSEKQKALELGQKKKKENKVICFICPPQLDLSSGKNSVDHELKILRKSESLKKKEVLKSRHFALVWA